MFYKTDLIEKSALKYFYNAYKSLNSIKFFFGGTCQIFFSVSAYIKGCAAFRYKDFLNNNVP